MPPGSLADLRPPMTRPQALQRHWLKPESRPPDSVPRGATRGGLRSNPQPELACRRFGTVQPPSVKLRRAPPHWLPDQIRGAPKAQRLSTRSPSYARQP